MKFKTFFRISFNDADGEKQVIEVQVNTEGQPAEALKSPDAHLGLFPRYSNLMVERMSWGVR